MVITCAGLVQEAVDAFEQAQEPVEDAFAGVHSASAAESSGVLQGTTSSKARSAVRTSRAPHTARPLAPTFKEFQNGAPKAEVAWCSLFSTYMLYHGPSCYAVHFRVHN